MDSRVVAGAYPHRGTALIQSMLDVANDLMAAFDRDCRFVAFNGSFAREFERIYGAAPRLGQSVVGAVPAEDAVAVKKLCARAMAGESFVAEETFGQGERRKLFELRVTLVPVGERAAAFAVVVVREVSVRHVAGQHFDALLEMSPDALLIMRADGTIEHVNSIAERLFGYENRALRGRSVEVLVPERFRRLHAQHVALYLSAPRTRPMGVGKSELIGLRADGREFPVEIALNPLHVGDTVLVAAAVRDATVTQRHIDELEERVLARTEALALANRRLEQKVIELDAARHSLEEGHDRLQAILDSLTEGVVVADLAGNVLEMSPAALALHGLTLEEARRPLSGFVSTFELHTLDGDLLPPEEWPLSRLVRGEAFADFEVEVRRKDRGTSTIVSYSGAPVRNREGAVILCVLTIRDVTQAKHADQARREAEQRLLEAALHDPLTGLPNRALVFEYGRHLIAAAQRNHGGGALLFVDLDRFKPINDLYGHEVGDRVLQEVGRRLAECTRQEDLVGRLGGDEFLIVLPHLDQSRYRAATVAKHLIERIGQPIVVDSLNLSVSPSIGISYFPEHGSDLDALIRAADLAMYQVKQSGRANYQFYSAELDRRADEARVLEASLKSALEHGTGLSLHYQPVVDIESGELIGAEALVRLAGPDGMVIEPKRVIPVAESAGLIGDLGEWVAAEACRQHEAWLDEGLSVSTMAINISPLQFRLPAFADMLHGILADTGIDPACLQLEVTESTVMDSVEDAIEILKRIKSLGVKVALDHFGLGYSNLARLPSLPVDKLKVDQCFVRHIECDRASRAVTEAIIALGRSLSLVVVGEGIESENALRYLQERGCNQAQGFWFSQPLPAEEFARWGRERWGQ